MKFTALILALFLAGCQAQVTTVKPQRPISINGEVVRAPIGAVQFCADNPTHYRCKP